MRARYEIYWNLHSDTWSVRHRGQVIGHSKHLLLTDPFFVVRPAGHRRALEEGTRNVHAFVCTRTPPELLHKAMAPDLSLPTRYNLNKGVFEIVADGHPVTRAREALLSVRPDGGPDLRLWRPYPPK